MCNMCDLEYENIHSHSMYSNIYTADSIITKEDIAIRAKELGHKTLSLVEHGYFSNIFETHTIAEKYGLNLIFGSEFYYVKDRFEKDNTNSHILIMARNEEGRKELTAMVSESNKTGFYYKPRIDEELLLKLTPENVLVTTACIASPINKYDDEYVSHFLEVCKEHFGESFFLEVQPHTNIKQVAFNQKLQAIHYDYGIPFILGIDSHYIYPEDAKDRDLFLKGKKINYPEEEGFIIDFPTTEQIIERFKEQNVLFDREIKEAFENSLIARTFEPVKIDKEIKMPTLYPELSHEQKSDKLKKLINKAWLEDRKHIPKDRWSEYIEAIKFETDIVIGTGMEDYFLINKEIINKAVNKYNGVLTRTGRGSAPSFYINKLLGFTEVDRLEAPIQLYATRFMSKSRILETKSLPDIDFNTSNPEPFIEASKELLGSDNIYWMIAYGTMQDSEAFRNYCRGLGLQNQSEINMVGKNLDDYVNDSYWGDLISKSKIFVGVIDSVSPHPCATVLLDKPVSEELGVIKIGDEMVSLIDSYNSDVYKYLKNDMLTVTVWDIVSKVYEKIEKPIDDVRTLIEKTKNDDKVWDLYKNGIVSTLNQAGTQSGKPQVMQYSPRNIRELSGWVSAIRPSFASMKHYFLNRKEFSYGIPEFDKILESSDNFVLYQEDIMATLVYAGFSEDETYGLLKAIAKKKEGIIEPIHDRFINGFVEKTGSEENALKVWKIIEDAVSYGFNASHAYSVALDSLYGAYLKANYPIEYYSVVLDIYNGNTSKQAEIISELDYFGIKMNNIKFGESEYRYSFNKDNKTISKGIGSIKYMNKQASDKLLELSSNTYDRDEFYLLCKDIIDSGSINKRQMEILINLNFFSDFGKSAELMEIYLCMKDEKKASFVYTDFADSKKVPLKYDPKHKDNTKQKRIENIKNYELTVKANPPKSMGIFELLKYEKENLGYSISTFPNVKEGSYVIMDINDRYTPLLELYNLQNGTVVMYKIKKNNYWKDKRQSVSVVNIGDVIRVIDTKDEFGWKKVDDDWVRNESKIETFITKLSILRKRRD